MISLTVSESQLEQIIDYQIEEQARSGLDLKILSVVNLRFSNRYCVLVDCTDQQAVCIYLRI